MGWASGAQVNTKKLCERRREKKHEESLRKDRSIGRIKSEGED